MVTAMLIASLLVASVVRFQVSTRWTTTPLSAVNLPHAIDLRTLYGVNLVTESSKYRGNITLEVHRVVSLPGKWFWNASWDAVMDATQR